jgi:hypothetical protein
MVEGYSVDTDTRSLDITCTFDAFVSHNELFALGESLKQSINLTSIKFNAKYNGDLYSSIAAEDIADELRAQNVMLNGYFNGALFNVEKQDDAHITTVTLKYGGYDIVKNSGFSQKFANIVVLTTTLQANFAKSVEGFWQRKEGAHSVSRLSNQMPSFVLIVEINFKKQHIEKMCCFLLSNFCLFQIKTIVCA